MNTESTEGALEVDPARAGRHPRPPKGGQCNGERTYRRKTIRCGLPENHTVHVLWKFWEGRRALTGNPNLKPLYECHQFVPSESVERTSS